MGYFYAKVSTLILKSTRILFSQKKKNIYIMFIKMKISPSMAIVLLVIYTCLPSVCFYMPVDIIYFVSLFFYFFPIICFSLSVVFLYIIS